MSFVYTFIYIVAFFFCPNEKNCRGSFHLICIAFVAVQRAVVVVVFFFFFFFSVAVVAVAFIVVGQGHLWTAKASSKWVQRTTNAAKRKAMPWGEEGNLEDSTQKKKRTKKKRKTPSENRKGEGQGSECKKLASNNRNLHLVGKIVAGWEMVGKCLENGAELGAHMQCALKL